MKQILVACSLAVLLFSCGTKKTETSTPDAPANLITEQQKADGWQLLFDGKSMDGWIIFKGKENDTWEVLDGTLHCKPVTETSAKRADLMTARTYQNFELTIDWKISPKGNSGLIYRVTEEYDVPYGTGPEYQLLDDLSYPEESDVHMTGSDYDLYPPLSRKANPVGEWNNTRIIVNVNHVEHWLNGEKVVEYEFGSDDWKKRVAGSKWKEFPNYGLATGGFIDLQDHGHEAWFKNIMIKTL